MTQQMIRCPKCSHEQSNQVECETCGLIFSKFAQARERETSAPFGPSTEPAKPLPAGGRSKTLGAALALVALTAALTYLLTGGNQSPPVAPPSPPPTVNMETQPTTPASPPKPPPRAVEQPQVAVSAGGPIERAKNGTVAIETPWGMGSGFFLTESTIVTNKHVIMPNQAQVEEIRHKVKTGRQLIKLEQEKIADLRQRLKQLEEGPTRRQVVIVIQEMEKRLAQVVPAQEVAEGRLREMEKPQNTSDIRIVLADGSEYRAQSTQVSTQRDLALLSVYSAQGTPLRPAGKNSLLQQGERVYTIGNPVGLRNTVTSGVFSGYRQAKDTGELLLQTDAPINPGNSGGPLIDERGQVHGINTMIIRDTQGIGFAIPIQAVFEDFALSPP